MQILDIIKNGFPLLHEINIISIIFRMFLALLMGGILGAERSLRHRPAGFMTYVLVCMGSTIIMLTNQYMSTAYPASDPTRLAAQVISGIGFLGAGTIIVTRNDEVRGLTTAAGLWLAAGLGLAVGCGFYSGAIIGFCFSIFALVGLKRIDVYIKQHAKTMEIYLEFNSDFSLRKLSDYALQQQYTLSDMQRGRVKTLNKELGTIIFSINMIRKQNHSQIIDNLYALGGVEYLREID